MARRRFALQQGEPKRLEVRWRFRRRQPEVWLEGVLLARLERAAFLEGTALTLPDGSSLYVRYEQPRWYYVGVAARLLVERDGQPVPGSDGHPRVIARGAARTMALFGGLILLFGLGWMLFETSEAWRAGQPIALEGALLAVFAVLAAFGLRTPILLGAILLALTVVLTVVGGQLPSPLGVIIHAAVAWRLFDAWRRMKPRPARPSLASVFE